MDLLELFRLAFESLLLNRLRSMLTMLGVIIGVGAVIALVAFGQGVEQYVKRTFQSLGSNLLFVFTTTPRAGNLADIKPLTNADADAIANPLSAPSVLRAVPQYNIFASVVSGRKVVTITINGVTPAFQQVRDWYPQVGRFIEDEDLSTAARVAVLGTSIVSELFDDGVDPVGQSIRINNLPFKVIGIMQTKGGGGLTGDQDRVLFIPIVTAQTRIAQARNASGSYTVSAILVQALSEQRMDQAKREIEQLLAQRQNVQFRDEESFQVVTQDQILSIVGNITALLTVFLSVIAGISLLVGGIGIMNIMLVSVTERTREIGLRKAVGAQNRDILLQFLIESVLLSLGGGTLGIGVGALGAYIGGRLVPELSLAVTPGAIMLATGVSTAVGVFFGLYPARRAALLPPIAALRFE